MATKRERKLVHIRGSWKIADRVPASAYGKQEPPGDCWSEPETTAYLGKVGDERAIADLPPEPTA